MLQVSESLMSCCRDDGKAFHTLGPTAEKLLLPELLCVLWPYWNSLFAFCITHKCYHAPKL